MFLHQNDITSRNFVLPFLSAARPINVGSRMHIVTLFDALVTGITLVFKDLLPLQYSKKNPLAGGGVK